MGEQNNEDLGNDSITVGEDRKEEGRKDESKDILEKVINEINKAIVPFDMDLLSTQNGTQSSDDNEKEKQEMQYDDLEDIVPMPLSQESEKIISSNNKRRRLNNEEDVTLSQLDWALAGVPRMNEVEMLDNFMKQPMMSTASKELTDDALKSKSEFATPPYHSLKLKLKRNSSQNYDAVLVSSVDKPDVAKETTVNVLDAVPVSSVAPINYIPIQKEQKEKSIGATKSKGEGRKAATKKEPAKKATTNVEQSKKALGKKGVTKPEMTKAKKAPTKKPEPKADKEDAQKVKRGKKRDANVMEETKEADKEKEKRTIKPSNAMVSPYYNRKVMIYERWLEAEMKLVEYIWSDSCPEG